MPVRAPVFVTLAVLLQPGTVCRGEAVVRELGIPVRSVNWVSLHAGRDRQDNPCLYAAMGQNAQGLFVLQIDPETGRFRQFVTPVRSANYPTATLMSRQGRFYVGAAYAGHLLRFDPARDTFEDLGAIHPGASTFPCGLDEDSEGRIWIGSYGTADLTCFDPRRREFVRYGRMDDVDMYNYPRVNADGTIACLIRMTRPHVVVLDPKTKAKQVVGPVTTQGQDTINLRAGADGRLYIASSLGNFRVDGMKAVPVATVPPGPPGRSRPSRRSEPSLPGVRSFAFTDGSEQTFRTLEIRKTDGTVRRWTLDYTASGSDIFYLHRGPDDCLYGSSILPLHLFRYNPKDATLADLGRCSRAAGEAYSMVNFQGKIYISAYPGAQMSVYDPARPYHFGSGSGDNPRDLGRIDNLSYRPRSTLAGPLGRVWLASLPDYGRWGGPLSCYDPATGKKTAYFRIVGDATCYTLAHLPAEGLIAVGTNIEGGSGTRPKAKQAALVLWDYRKEQKAWEGTFPRPVTAFNALLTGPDGRLFGTVIGGGRAPEFFVFDPKARTFPAHVDLPAGRPLDLGLQNGPDGQIYGLTSQCLYRLDPSSLAIEEVLSDSEGFHVPGPIIGRDLYFGTGHRLRAARLWRDEKGS